jgi:aspartate aminotransferase
MALSTYIQEAVFKASWIRKLFEIGGELKQKYGDSAVQDLSLGNPVQEPPSAFFDCLAELSTRRHEGLHRYMNNGGLFSVREAIADFLERKGLLYTDASHIVMSVGAGGALNVLCKTLLNPQDEMIILTPYFPEYYFYILNHGGVPIPVDTDSQFLPDLDKIEAAISPRTRAIILNSPNNPSGVVYPEKLILELQKRILHLNEKRENPIFLVSDEPYRELYYGTGSPAPVVAHFPYGIMIYSWSKSLSIAGDRIGYIAVPKDCPEKKLVDGLICCTRILGFINAPVTQQLIVAKLLDISVPLDLYRQDRTFVLKSLRESAYSFVEPMGAFYVFPQSPLPDDVRFCQLLLEEEKVLVVPGTGFKRPGYFRISYAAPREVLEKAMEKLQRVSLRFQ